jgi:nitrogen PTS system EIIA component
MPLNELLNADRIAILADSGDRGTVLDAAARLLIDPAAAGAASAAAVRAIGDSLRAREQLASTGIGHGVAIPHGRIRGIEAARGAFLRLSSPADFGAGDGTPVDLVLAMAVPEHYVQEHLQQLAELAERFAVPEFRHRLREAPDLTALRHCLLGDARRSAA